MRRNAGNAAYAVPRAKRVRRTLHLSALETRDDEPVVGDLAQLGPRGDTFDHEAEGKLAREGVAVAGPGGGCRAKGCRVHLMLVKCFVEGL